MIFVNTNGAGLEQDVIVEAETRNVLWCGRTVVRASEWPYGGSLRGGQSGC